MNPNFSNRFWLRRISLLGLSILSVVVAGCSPAPRASSAERIVRAEIAQNAGGRIELLSFQKTNGTEAEFIGVHMYALELTVEIEFTQNCKWLRGGMGEKLTFATSAQTGPEGGAMMQLLQGVADPGSFVRKGQRFRINGVQRYAKKESGWVPAGLELTNAMPLGAP